MPEFEDVTVTGQQMWLKSQGYPNNYDKALLLTATPEVSDAYVSYERGCFCVTKERPKVEYSYCLSGSGIGECADEKGAQGWIPQGGIHVTRDGIVSQAFWRWAN